MNWDLIWGAALLTFAIGFGILQHHGLREGHQLSRHLRAWLGITPPHPRRWILGTLFVGALAWFGTHILTPWL